MTCYFPVDIWISKFKKENGKRDVVHNYDSRKHGDYDRSQRACGGCVGCRLAKSREWSIRCMHEASLHWNNCWLTLTLNEEYKQTRKNPYSLERGQKSELTRFLKRLRKKFGSGIRYYYCGEYGETCFYCNKSERFCSCRNFTAWRGRPHYHVCIFNHDFDDKKFYKNINGLPHYTSPTLDKLWTDPATKLNMGTATISDLTPDSAAYTARYTMKKVYGELSKTDHPVLGILHYQRLIPDGEIIDLIPEFTNMSRGSKHTNTGGIGKGWLDAYSKEVLDNDAVLFKTCRIKPPRFYDLKLEKIDPDLHEENKFNRLDKAAASPDNTPERLQVREYIARQKSKQLHRKEF